MKTFKPGFRPISVLALAAFALIGCESTDGDGGGGAVYYGTGFNDPWYYGDYYYDGPDYIVTPPDRPSDPRPSHPIATPPMSGPRPTPTMPSMPRVSGGR